MDKIQENYHIENIETFNTTSTFEYSIIGDVIRNILQLKKDVSYKSSKKIKPYSIQDKLEKNKIHETFSKIILEQHINNYDIVDDVISMLTLNSINIKNEIFEIYKIYYLETLTELNIRDDDYNSIKSNSTLIYQKILKQIHNEIFVNKITNIKSEDLKKYIHAITAYVFYKCKFLLSIE